AYSPHVTPETWSLQIRWHYLLTQCWGLARMIRLAFWPHPLVFFYGMSLVADPLTVWSQALFLLALAGGTIWALARWPRVGFAGLFFFGVLAPSSTFIPILGQPVAEHRMYAPLAALIALVAGGVYAAMTRTGRRAAVSVFLLLGVAAAFGLGVAAHRRNVDYRNPLILWEDTVRKVPGSPEPHNDYANALREAGRTTEAVAQYQEALRLKPGYVDAHNNLGTLLAQLGRYEEAARHLEEALRLKPNSPQIHHNLGSVYEQMGRYEDALPHLEIICRVRPDDPRVLAQLVHVLAELGRGDEALERLQAALAARPGDPELNNTLGVLLCRLGRPDEAVAVLRAALAGPPGRPRVRFNLGRALFEAGRMDEAEKEFLQVLTAEPGAGDARAYLDRLRNRRADEPP
ncbi:MAG: tetratricopeptide repeat protein, partial [Verrucomicrobia bacterium]|nr:tetratricopeptide repeat protein [Verrucomicrobiota bacterium]